MAGWLNPVRDFLDAMKSGASAGLELAKIRSDNAQAAAKLNQSAQAEEDQRQLGYAKLGSEERQGQESAAEKLKAALSQNAALTDYRNRSLDEKSNAASNLLDYKRDALGTRAGLQQQGIDLKSNRYDTLASNFQQKLAQNQAQFDSTMGNKMSDADKLAYNAAQSKQKVALKSLTDTLDNPDSASHALAAKTLADEQGNIDRISAKYGATGTSPGGGAGTSAVNALITPQSTVADPSQNYNLFAPTTTGDTGAAAALTPTTSNSPPSSVDETDPLGLFK